MDHTNDLIREIQEHTAAHGVENTATHLLVQAATALQRQADELASIGAGGVSGSLLGQPQGMPDLSQLIERGTRAWAGVDAQSLREGAAPQAAPAYPPLPEADKVIHPSHSEPYALWGLKKVMAYAKAYHEANAAPQAAPAVPDAILKLAASQEPLGAEFEAVLNTHRSELYAEAAPQPEAAVAVDEEAYRLKWDAELGRTAMRFVDRAGDVHPGIDDAEKICADFYKAMSDVVQRMPHVQRMRAPMEELLAAAGKVEAAPQPEAADEAMRKDAERYRWLRKPLLHVGQGSIDVRMDDRLRGHFSRQIYGEELDAAIDAALAAKGDKP